jgi:hypothetical protein
LKKQVVHVLIVTDDDTAAHCLVRLMHIAWERDGSGHKRSGLNVKWTITHQDTDKSRHGLDEFILPTTNALTPFSEPTVLGALSADDYKEKNGKLDLMVDGRSPGIRLLRGDSRIEFSVRIRMVPAHHFADHRVDVASVAGLLTKRDPEDNLEPTDFVLLGVTDASLERRVNPGIGSGVDQILAPGLLGKIAAALPVEPRVGIAITGLERDFVQFDVSDPRWSKYESAHEAAWDPALIRYMLHQVVLDRPHLSTLMQTDQGFRSLRDRPIVITAVMPCGFLRDWNCINYNSFEPGWIEGSPAIRGERDAPYFVPYCCADPLLTALTGMRTEFQLTSRDFQRMSPGPRQRRVTSAAR